MKSLRLKIILPGVLFAAGMVAVVSFTREPSADGRSFSGWLRLGTEFHYPRRDNSDVTNALRKIGVKGVPILLDKLTAKDAAWKRMFDSKWGYRFQTYRWIHRASDEHFKAFYGFSILGTQAVVAIPELSRMLNVPNSSDNSAHALARIGPKAWVVLKSGLTNPTPFVRAASLAGMNSHRVDLEDVWPEVMERRHDTNFQVSVRAMFVILDHPEKTETISIVSEGLKHPSPQIQEVTLSKLRDWGTGAAAPVVPLIIPFLTNANPQLQRAAKFALLKADPAEARLHNIPENGPP